MATIKQLLADGEQALADGDSPRLDAEVLLACSVNQPRTWLYTWPEHVPTPNEQHLFLELLRRRREGEPVAYLTGRKEFWNLELKVTPDVLIPRPETELLVETILDKAGNIETATIADLGTGSGAIVLALASEKPAWHLVATDASSKALAVAKENAASLGIENVEFLPGVEGDWIAPLEGKRFTVIVSNPPYIEEADTHLSEGDVRFEPVSALVSGRDGLDAIRDIAGNSPDFIKPGGWLMLEHGYSQGEAVRKILCASGYDEIGTLKDLAGLDRVTVGRIKDKRQKIKG